MTRPVAVLLRFDTEDFLTPESDDAALFIAWALRRRGLRATFPITAWKVASLLDRGRGDVLEALSEHAVGFHSTSHSFHPTIAEELSGVPDSSAEERFLQREEDGLRLVAEHAGRPLSAYTQPGGNWVAEATHALRAWGVPLYYSEGWNSYIDVGGRPYFLGGVLAFAGEVAAPKPFLSRLPESLEAAKQQLLGAVRRAREESSRGVGLVNVVSHPTELIAETFWDQANFALGRNRPRDEWAPPPVRSVETVLRAQDSFEQWLDALTASGVEVWTAEDLVKAFPDPAAPMRFDRSDAAAIAAAWERGNVGSVAVRGVPLSAAEALTVLAHAASSLRREAGPFAASAFRPAAPWGATDAGSAAGAVLPHGAVLEAAHSLLGEERLPARVPVLGTPLSLLDIAGALARSYLHLLGGGDDAADCPIAPGRLLPARHVKPRQELHWDWPIFPPGFQPDALRRRALDATWTLKPAEAEICDHLA